MATSSPAALGWIFMSYRREETAYPAGWLYNRLSVHFGRSQVFKDVDSIELGDDFVDVINAAVGSCDVLLAVIGDRWLTITDAEGKRRIDDPHDFVRLEIEAALARGVRVIPILVEGVRMPRTDDLPVSIAMLARRQALELSPNRFDFDIGRLLRVLDNTLSSPRVKLQPKLVSPSASVTLNRPKLIEVSEEPIRRDEPIGEEVRVIDNTRNSLAIERTLSVSRTWTVSASVDLNQARAINGDGEVRFRDLLDAKTNLRNTIASHYSLRIDAEQVYEQSISTQVPAHLNIEQVIQWKRIWAKGVAFLVESAEPTVAIVQVPYEITVGVAFDIVTRRVWG